MTHVANNSVNERSDKYKQFVRPSNQIFLNYQTVCTPIFLREGVRILKGILRHFSVGGGRNQRIIKGDVLMNAAISDLPHMSHTMTL